MAVEGSGFGIIEDSLIRNFDIKDRTEDKSGFSGAYSKREIEG